jgi:hypothetical protein
MPQEPLYWHKGLAWDTRSELQQPGYLETAKNITFKIDGEQGLRPQFTAINSTALNAIHSVKRFRDKILIGDSTNIRQIASNISSGGTFTSLGSAFEAALLDFQEYKDFLFLCNGTNSLMMDEYGSLFNTVIANPATAATLADSGTAGNPDDTYVGYVTYELTFPNGQKYETGLSTASSDVTVATNKISWSAIPTCTYTAEAGTEPTIYRKLYRGPGTGGSLADIYLVTTIEDNTTTTYTDDVSDTQLAANGASYVDDYTTMPAPKYQAFHYGRWFAINESNPHRLYYSEAAGGATGAVNELIVPIAIKATNWDDIRVAGLGRLNVQGLVAWGTYLYIPLKHTWLRKYGNDPDTWSFKKTWSDFGIGAPYSVTTCGKPTGILGVTFPRAESCGLALFNGQLSQIISSPKYDWLFDDDMNHDAIGQCRGTWDGRYYHLLYPSGDETEPDKWAAFDLSKFPDIRLAYWHDLNGRSIDVDSQSKKVYVGGSDGYLRQNELTETIDIEVRTHDHVGGSPEVANATKTLKQLKYSLDTGGDDVTLEIYMDGSLITFSDDTTSQTISGTGDVPQYLPNIPVTAQGYSYAAKITGSGLSTFELYSPWIMEFDI